MSDVLHIFSSRQTCLFLSDQARGGLEGLPALAEAEALDVAVRRDPLRLRSRLHFVDLHLWTLEFLEWNGT